MQQTLFGRIVAGELPCHRVFENDLVLAFLDVAPLAPGHTLVIPKEPAATLDALSEASSAAIGAVLPRLCRAVLAATGSTAYNILQNNGVAAHQAVMHVHFHLIPKPATQSGLGIIWQTQPLDAAVAVALAAEIRTRLAVTAPATQEG